MAYQRNKFTRFTPATLASGDSDLIADPGDGYEAVVARAVFQNIDTVDRTLILKDSAGNFYDIILTAKTVVVFGEESDEPLVATASAAVVVNASAGSAIKLCGGRWYKRPAR